jgi:hypothetical protein
MKVAYFLAIRATLVSSDSLMLEAVGIVDISGDRNKEKGKQQNR